MAIRGTAVFGFIFQIWRILLENIYKSPLFRCSYFLFIIVIVHFLYYTVNIVLMYCIVLVFIFMLFLMCVIVGLHRGLSAGCAAIIIKTLESLGVTSISPYPSIILCYQPSACPASPHPSSLSSSSFPPAWRLHHPLSCKSTLPLLHMCKPSQLLYLCLQSSPDLSL